MEGVVDGYSHYSNDVGRGERPTLVKISENDREFNGRTHGISKSGKVHAGTQGKTEYEVKADSDESAFTNLIIVHKLSKTEYNRKPKTVIIYA